MKLKVLVIEVDGDIHQKQVEWDQVLTEQFETHGNRVIRFGKK